jgi:hypothetical protein
MHADLVVAGGHKGKIPHGEIPHPYLSTDFDVSSDAAGGTIAYQSKAQTFSCSLGISAALTALKFGGGLPVTSYQSPLKAPLRSCEKFETSTKNPAVVGRGKSVNLMSSPRVLTPIASVSRRRLAKSR